MTPRRSAECASESPRFVRRQHHEVSIFVSSLDLPYKVAFEELASKFIGRDDLNCLGDESLIISGLVTEGIPIPDEAVLFAMACRSAVKVGEKVYVGYLGLGGRPRCIELSAISKRLIDLQAPLPDSLEGGRSAVRAWLKDLEVPKFEALDGVATDPLSALARCASAYWLNWLPGPLVPDALGLTNNVPVPMSALARLACRSPLRRSELDTAHVMDGADQCAMIIGSGAVALSGNVSERVKEIMSLPQKGILAALRKSQIAELDLLLDEVAENEIGALQLLCAFELCTNGTVTKVDPSASIGRRYIREIVDLTDRYPEDAANLTLLDSDERVQVYERWISAGHDPVDASAALSALDTYLVRNFDIEPARVRHANWEFEARAIPRILWNHELTAIVDAIPAVARTPALARVALAVFEIANQKPVRPGDFRDAMFGDLDLSDDELTVVFDIRRRRGKKGSKTPAGQHPLEFGKAAKTSSMRELLAFRASRGATDGDPLWGETLKESRRLFSAACALISQLCKCVTGDALQSFYSLRHTCFSRDIEEALMPSALAARPRWIHKIANEGGHVHPSTSILWYFHLPMAVVRAHADVSLTQFLTAKATANWAGVSQDVLYKRASRAGDDRSEVELAAIHAAVDMTKFPCVSESNPCQLTLTIPSKRRLPLFDDVLHALAYADDARAVLPSGDAMLSDWERTVCALRDGMVAKFNGQVRLVQTDQFKLRGIRSYVSRHWRDAETRAACQEWESNPRSAFPDISKMAALNNWLTFLKAAGVPASRIQIRVTDGMADNKVRITDYFASVFGCTPAIDQVPDKYNDRPLAYLMLSSDDIKADEPPSPARLNMAGFNSVMLAATARIRIFDLYWTQEDVK